MITTMEAISNTVQDLVGAIVKEARLRDCDMQVVLVGPTNEKFVEDVLCHTLDVVVGGSNPTEFFHHALGLDLSGNSTLALVMRSAIISVLEENFSSVQMFGHRLAFLRHCHNRWSNDRTLNAEYNKHMAQRNIN
jgi:hypothetical protein